MKLERVDITGFKSFGEKAELTFHEGVTAVVGPNGCGKSNIADAIGWVLGEQSAKSLRGQKMEDLIFNGSESRQPLSLAEVNLRVSNVIVPGSKDETNGHAARGEALVTRRLNRSGQSEYLLDGAPSRLRDVQDLFMGTGVGSKAYAIIEQGKIGLVLSGKPTDRRFIIEEAAGITKYKARRRQAELKLTAAQQNLMRVNDIVYEITRQMNSLKRQAGKARRYRRLRDQMARLEKVFAVKQAQVQQLSLDSLQKRLVAVSDEEQRRATSLSTADGYLERTRLRQADLEVSLTEARETQHQLELTIERLDQQIARDKAQLVELANRRSQLETEMRELEARRGPVNDRLQARTQEQATLEQELEGREHENREQQGRLKRASLSLAELESSIEERRSEIVRRISKIAALRNFLQGVLANADKVAGELLKLSEEIREVESERGRVEGSLTETVRELDAREEEARSLEARREGFERQAEEARAALEQADARLAAEKDSLSTSAARLASLEELVAARAHFTDGARLLLARGDRHGIRIKGSVADAIEVEEKFERAAEAFYDTALQRIQVEDEQDVIAARSVLEGHEDAARSELVVASMPPARVADLADALASLRRAGIVGAMGLLSESVRFRHEGLAQSMPDAIVVEDLETALRCFRIERASFVTLAGEVVTPAGVVAVGPGGASEGLLRTKREIRELQENVQAKRAGITSALEDRRRLSETKDELKKTLERTREEQHDLDKTKVGLVHKRDQLAEDRSRLARKHEVLSAERERGESEKSALSGKRVEMESALTAEEAGKSEAETLLDTMRGELSSRRSSVEDLQSRSAEEASRLAALRERHDAVRSDVERLSEGAKELHKRLDANGTEQRALSERDGNLKEAIARAQSDLASSVTTRDGTEKQVGELEHVVSETRDRVLVTESALKLRRAELDEVRERRSADEVDLAKEESAFRHLSESFENAHDMTLADAAPLLDPVDLLRDDTSTQTELTDLKEKLDAIGPVNPMADDEFRELETRNEFVTQQRQDLLDSIQSTESAISKIDRTSRQRFKEAFDAINEEFAVTFRQLFGGGRAGLSLLDETDVLESGIEIIAQPPGKALQNVLLLSGGEKAMTAIALLFAIFRYRPSPFCLLDEVDAPLDDANVGRFIGMVRELRDTTQFIVITHNRKTMEMADHLYGITMAEPGVSKLVSVDFTADSPEPVEAIAAAR